MVMWLCCGAADAATDCFARADPNPPSASDFRHAETISAKEIPQQQTHQNVNDTADTFEEEDTSDMGCDASTESFEIELGLGYPSKDEREAAAQVECGDIISIGTSSCGFLSDEGEDDDDQAKATTEDVEVQCDKTDISIEAGLMELMDVCATKKTHATIETAAGGACVSATASALDREGWDESQDESQQATKEEFYLSPAADCSPPEPAGESVAEGGITPETLTATASALDCEGCDESQDESQATKEVVSVSSASDCSPPELDGESVADDDKSFTAYAEQIDQGIMPETLTATASALNCEGCDGSQDETQATKKEVSVSPAVDCSPPEPDGESVADEQAEQGITPSALTATASALDCEGCDESQDEVQATKEQVSVSPAIDCSPPGPAGESAEQVEQGVTSETLLYNEGPVEDGGTQNTENLFSCKITSFMVSKGITYDSTGFLSTSLDDDSEGKADHETPQETTTCVWAHSRDHEERDDCNISDDHSSDIFLDISMESVVSVQENEESTEMAEQGISPQKSENFAFSNQNSEAPDEAKTTKQADAAVLDYGTCDGASDASLGSVPVYMAGESSVPQPEQVQDMPLETTSFLVNGSVNEQDGARMGGRDRGIAMDEHVSNTAASVKHAMPDATAEIPKKRRRINKEDKTGHEISFESVAGDKGFEGAADRVQYHETKEGTEKPPANVSDTRDEGQQTEAIPLMMLPETSGEKRLTDSETTAGEGMVIVDVDPKSVTEALANKAKQTMPVETQLGPKPDTSPIASEGSSVAACHASGICEEVCSSDVVSWERGDDKGFQNGTARPETIASSDADIAPARSHGTTVVERECRHDDSRAHAWEQNIFEKVDSGGLPKGTFISKEHDGIVCDASAAYMVFSELESFLKKQDVSTQQRNIPAKSIENLREWGSRDMDCSDDDSADSVDFEETFVALDDIKKELDERPTEAKKCPLPESPTICAKKPPIVVDDTPQVPLNDGNMDVKADPLIGVAPETMNDHGDGNERDRESEAEALTVDTQECYHIVHEADPENSGNAFIPKPTRGKEVSGCRRIADESEVALDEAANAPGDAVDGAANSLESSTNACHKDICQEDGMRDDLGDDASAELDALLRSPRPNDDELNEYLAELDAILDEEDVAWATSPLKTVACDNQTHGEKITTATAHEGAAEQNVEKREQRHDSKKGVASVPLMPAPATKITATKVISAQSSTSKRQISTKSPAKRSSLKSSPAISAASSYAMESSADNELPSRPRYSKHSQTEIDPTAGAGKEHGPFTTPKKPMVRSSLDKETDCLTLDLNQEAQEANLLEKIVCIGKKSVKMLVLHGDLKAGTIPKSEVLTKIESGIRSRHELRSLSFELAPLDEHENSRVFEDDNVLDGDVRTIHKRRTVFRRFVLHLLEVIPKMVKELNIRMPPSHSDPVFTTGFADRLSRALNGSCHRLTNLTLSATMDADGAKKIAVGLGQCPLLEYLCLHCDLGDEGVRAFAKLCLHNNRKLKVLSLALNKIGDDGALSIARNLKDNASLTKLDLSSNQIRNGGIAALVECLKSNQMLSILDLDNNLIERKSIELVSGALRENQSLTELYIRGAAYDLTGMMSLRDTVHVMNRAILRIKMDVHSTFSDLTDEECTKMKKAEQDLMERLRMNRISTILGHPRHSLWSPLAHPSVFNSPNCIFLFLRSMPDEYEKQPSEPMPDEAKQPMVKVHSARKSETPSTIKTTMPNPPFKLLATTKNKPSTIKTTMPNPPFKLPATTKNMASTQDVEKREMNMSLILTSKKSATVTPATNRKIKEPETKKRMMTANASKPVTSTASAKLPTTTGTKVTTKKLPERKNPEAQKKAMIPERKKRASMPELRKSVTSTLRTKTPSAPETVVLTTKLPKIKPSTTKLPEVAKAATATTDTRKPCTKTPESKKSITTVVPGAKPRTVTPDTKHKETTKRPEEAKKRPEIVSLTPAFKRLPVKPPMPKFTPAERRTESPTKIPFIPTLSCGKSSLLVERANKSPNIAPKPDTEHLQGTNQHLEQSHFSEKHYSSHPLSPSSTAASTLSDEPRTPNSAIMIVPSPPKWKRQASQTGRRRSSTKKGNQCCEFPYSPNLFHDLQPCKRCLQCVSEEDLAKLKATGHHVGVMWTHGGCRHDCRVFAEQRHDKSPVPLCKKCFYDTHKKDMYFGQYFQGSHRILLDSDV